MHAKRTFIVLFFLLLYHESFCWGFYAHQKINYYAVFLLPPQLLVFYKPHLAFITQHAVDPDKKRYISANEAPHHFIDIDHYGNYPYDSLPHYWKAAVTRYSEDTLNRYGTVPWWVVTVLGQLTDAFKEKKTSQILKLSAAIGHYIADAHVPLHACSNHNGQLTNQEGIHAFWESRIPELLATREWNFYLGTAQYIDNPVQFIWARVLESAAAADTVLKAEKELSAGFTGSKWTFAEKNGKLLKQYTEAYIRQYNRLLKGMVERRMQQAVMAVASFWYTAWINAGQPDLSQLTDKSSDAADRAEFQLLDRAWKNGKMQGRPEEE